MNLVYWLLCLLIGLIPAWLVFRKDRTKEIPIKWLPALLRGLTISMAAALLLAPAFSRQKTEEEKPLIIWLQDNSSSMQRSLGNRAADYQAKADQLKKSLDKGYEMVAWSFGSQLDKDSLFQYHQATTDISSALQSVTAQYADRNIGAIILASDGIYNQGADPRFLTLNKPVPVYTIALGDSTAPRDLMVKRIMANKVVSKGNNFEILVDIGAEKFTGNTTAVLLQQNGHTLQQTNVTVDKAQYHATLQFEAKATGSGFQKYTIVLPPGTGEQNTGNNHMDFYVEIVDEAIKVLLAAPGPHPDIAAIRQALEAVSTYEVDIKYGNTLPTDLKEYGLLIAYQLPGTTALTIPEDMPVWYILGQQTNLSLFNRQQAVVNISGAATPNDALPLYNNNFNYFTLPPNIREVVEQMPPLQATYGKYTATGQVLLHQQIGAISTDQPLWIIQTGVPSVAVLCGTGIWRWRLYEYKHFKQHQVVDELIRQTVNLLKERKNDKSYKVFMDKYLLHDNEPVYLFAELRNENKELINQPDARITLKDSSGKTLDFHFEKSGHSYRLNPGLLAAGTWKYTSSVTYNGKTQAVEGSFAISAVPLEQLRSHADYDLLSIVAGNTGGAFFTQHNMLALQDTLDNNTSLVPLLHTNKTYVSLIDWKWLFLIILLTVTAEWWLRKYWSLN